MAIGAERFSVQAADGRRWVELTLSSLGPDSPDTAFVVAIRDISDAVEATEMVAFREGQFTAFFEMCPYPILLGNYDTAAIIDGNQAFKATFGLDPAQSPELTIDDILPENTRWIKDVAITTLRTDGSFGPLETVLRRNDGRQFPVVLRGFKSVDPDGRRLIWALIEDITMARTTETALIAQRQEAEDARTLLATAIAALDDGFAIFDAEDRLILWNDTYRRIFSDLSDLIEVGARYADLWRAAADRGLIGVPGPEDAPGRGAGRGEEIGSWDGESQLLDGRVIWSRETQTLSGGRVGLYADVTERRQSERRLQQVVEGGEVGVWEWRGDGGMTGVDEQWLAILGYEPGPAQEPDARNLRTLCHPDDRGLLADVMRRVWTDDAADFDLVIRLRHKAGRWVALMLAGAGACPQGGRHALADRGGPP
ncbi:MAG: PAS domain S-box protein [Tabrizicola sp.]|nr:PAS domain S-box protein [Tabrizicola sp.]